MSQTRDTADIRQMAVYPAERLVVDVLQQLEGLDEGLDVAQVVQDIRDIAESVCERLEPGAALGDVIFTLNDQLFNVLDFHCTPVNYAEPKHTLLHCVLQRRTADPLTLGVIYICVGRWLGLSFRGCDFPGRFLVRFSDDLGGAVIDPACGGVQLQEEDLGVLLKHRFGQSADKGSAQGFLCDVDDSYLVMRLLRRLKQSYLKLGELVQALKVQEKIMALVPDMPSDFLERGLIYEKLGCARAAAEDYSHYLDLVPETEGVAELSDHLSQLLRRPLVLH